MAKQLTWPCCRLGTMGTLLLRAVEEQRGRLCRGLAQGCSRLLTLAARTATSGEDGKQKNEDQMEELYWKEAFQLTFWCRRIFPLRSRLLEPNNPWREQAGAGWCLQLPALVLLPCPTQGWFLFAFKPLSSPPACYFSSSPVSCCICCSPDTVSFPLPIHQRGLLEPKSLKSFICL